MAVSKDKHRFVIVIEKELLEKVKELAKQDGRSTSNFMAKLIKDYVESNS